MLELCLLGTGGMLPLPYRYLTSLYCQSEGKGLLIDCGEATQIALKKAGYSPNPIDYILITHFHADHISGLVGLLLSIGNSDRVDPVTIVGPAGLNDVVKSMRIIAPQLPFKVNIVELKQESGEFLLSPYRIQYYTLKHRMPCIGYNILLDRLPEFIVEKAKANDVPLKYWNKLQHGEDNIKDKDTGKVYTRDMVMGEARKGLKVSYFTDTRPCDHIMEWTKDCDLMIAEGMYGLIEEKLSNAKKYLHMTMREACEIAKENDPKILWLTHYSPSEVKPKIYEEELRKIFDRLNIVRDGEKIVLKFEDNV